jgi:hypothetical protein
MTVYKSSKSSRQHSSAQRGATPQTKQQTPHLRLPHPSSPLGLTPRVLRPQDVAYQAALQQKPVAEHLHGEKKFPCVKAMNWEGKTATCSVIRGVVKATPVVERCSQQPLCISRLVIYSSKICSRQDKRRVIQIMVSGSVSTRW